MLIGTYTDWSKSLKEINIQNMNVELVAQMFKNYRSNVLFHLEGEPPRYYVFNPAHTIRNRRPDGAIMIRFWGTQFAQGCLLDGVWQGKIHVHYALNV
jgi:hypothetical protein